METMVKYVYHDPWTAMPDQVLDTRKPCMVGQVYQRRVYIGVAETYAEACSDCVPNPERIAYDVRVMRVDT